MHLRDPASMSSQQQVPNTPRVISPSPTSSETSGKEGYFPPATRSRTKRLSSVAPIEEDHHDGEYSAHDETETDPELLRARSRSRSSQLDRKPIRMSANGSITTGAKTAGQPSDTVARARRKDDGRSVPNGAPSGSTIQENGLLSPTRAYTQGFGSAYWRNLSRSPSPLGLIPIHREWRAFVHKHEIPRKFLHVSIGFVTLWLYCEGAQTDQIHPVLLGLLVPILTVEIVRFRVPEVNRFYIRCLGAFMREAEAHDRFNGVISYIAGLWATMYFCSKDVAVMSVLLLSWCDTAASTFGRLWGKYTPRIRKGKSLAGSLAAFTIGVGASFLFWGLIVPRVPSQRKDFAFNGALTLPAPARELLGWSKSEATINGGTALSVMSMVSGLVASVSEAIDIWSLDDNLTIPVLCGAGLGIFLWGFDGY